MDMPNDKKTLLRRALAGENLALDSSAYTLHDLTQIAVALQPGAGLSIRNTSMMTPIERASISTVGKGRVMFF